MGAQYVRFAELGTNTCVSDTDGSGTEAQWSVPARWSISAHRARPEGAQKNQKARRSLASKEGESCFKQRLDLILATGKVFLKLFLQHINNETSISFSQLPILVVTFTKYKVRKKNKTQQNVNCFKF